MNVLQCPIWCLIVFVTCSNDLLLPIPVHVTTVIIKETATSYSCDFYVLGTVAVCVAAVVIELLEALSLYIGRWHNLQNANIFTLCGYAFRFFYSKFHFSDVCDFNNKLSWFYF